jgi:hypothetical protein
MTNRKVTLDFDISDLPLLTAGMRTAAAEAMMENKPRAKERLQLLRERIMAIVPEPLHIFGGLTLGEICIAVSESKTWAVGFEKWGYKWDRTGNAGGDHGYVIVYADGRGWKSRENQHLRDGGIIDKVAEAVSAIAPLDSVRMGVEDTLPWHLQPASAPKAAADPAPRRHLSEEDYDDYGDDGGSYAP